MAKVSSLTFIMLCINLMVNVINWIAPIILPVSIYPTVISLPFAIIDIPYLQSLGNIPALLVSSAVISLIAFTLRPITLSYVIGLYTVSIILMGFYIGMLPIPEVFKTVVYVIIGLMVVNGIVEWASAGKV